MRGKHILQAHKVGVSVLLNDSSIGLSDHYPGTVPDFEIIQR